MEWLSDVYLVCAVVGGTLLVVQTVLSAIGGGHGDHDMAHGVDHDTGALHDPHDVGHERSESVFVKWLSLRTIVALLTFFGLAGLASAKAGLSTGVGLGISLAVGAASVFVVAFLMASLSRLQSQGNLNLNNAVGLPAKVYLRIPGAMKGHGKITLEVQGRFVEVEAVSAGPEIPTGADVRVVALISPETVEVLPLGADRA
jgi:hypothetical protein